MRLSCAQSGVRRVWSYALTTVRLDEVLSAIIARRKAPPMGRSEHLVPYAGCRRAENVRMIHRPDYITHVVAATGRRRLGDGLSRCAAAGGNRFRKLLARYAEVDRRRLSQDVSERQHG